jgi:hypothetical protein
MVHEAMHGLPRVIDKILLWCQCNVIPVSTLKQSGGSSLNSLCGDFRCCLYSTRDRGGGEVRYALLLSRAVIEEFDVLLVL